MWKRQEEYELKQEDVKVIIHGVQPKLIRKRKQSFDDPQIHDENKVYIDKYCDINWEEFVNYLQWRYRYSEIRHNNYGFTMKEIVSFDSKALSVGSTRKCVKIYNNGEGTPRRRPEKGSYANKSASLCIVQQPPPNGQRTEGIRTLQKSRPDKLLAGKMLPILQKLNVICIDGN